MKFLRNLVASLLALFIFFFLVFVGAIVFAITASTQQKVVVKEGSVLKLNLSKPIQEIPIEDPFSQLNLPSAGGSETIGLKDLQEALQNAKEDNRIAGIYLNLSGVSSGYGILREVRNALLSFKESGKFIYAYGEYMTEGAYYLASVADRIVLNPAGAMEFDGLTAEKIYFKGMFDKLGIVPQIFKVGDFKSAVEPYTSTEMSEADRLQTEMYLNDLYDLYLADVASSLGKTPEGLETVSDSMFAFQVEQALANQLITDIAYEDSAHNLLRSELELASGDKIPFVSLGFYQKAEQEETSYSSNRVAVILAEGAIVSGEGGTDMIGSESLVKQLQKVRKDKKVKAVVLRVNSPGGSALASDVIWREVKLTAAEKPIIASMSDVAASGGYYIAMACDTIMALPNTITGSIGIFSTFFQLDEFFADKMGITFDEVRTGEFSNIGSPFGDFSPLEKQRLQQAVEKGYVTFTSKAAEDRGLPLDSLQSIASGRVWSGTRAKELGLVDILGGLQDAIALAAELGEITDDYSVRYYPEKQNLFDDLFKNGFAQIKEQELKKELGPLYPTLKEVRTLQQWQGLQARMPYRLIIR